MSPGDLRGPLEAPEPQRPGEPLRPGAQGLDEVPTRGEPRPDLVQRAETFAAALVAEEPRSPAFRRRVEDVARMGEADIRSSAGASGRMLGASGSLGGGAGAGASAAVSRTLQDLRAAIADLDPGRADLTGARRILGLLPVGGPAKRYFARYRTAQDHLDAIIRSLVSGQDRLRRDNAAIEQERAELQTAADRLGDYAALARALDDAVSARIERLRPVDPAAAEALTAEALLPIRQRRQDLAAQIAVSMQGSLALDLVRSTNLELVRGVERARTTTVAALRTAVVVAQALADQRLVLDRIEALNGTATAAAGAAGRLLQQGASGADAGALQRAFDEVVATVDAIDAHRARAAREVARAASTLQERQARSPGGRGALEA